jgi:hypothetical protein
MQLHIPDEPDNQFKGVVMVEYAIEGLLRYTVPAEISARHAVSLVDGNNTPLAGQSIQTSNRTMEYSPWESKAYEYIVPDFYHWQQPATACAGLSHFSGVDWQRPFLVGFAT